MLVVVPADQTVEVKDLVEQEVVEADLEVMELLILAVVVALQVVQLVVQEDLELLFSDIK
jgi:hypothetical protein